jgi:hypothetical protein
MSFFTTNLLKLNGIVDGVAEDGCEIRLGEVDEQELLEQLRLMKVLAC